MPGKTPSALDNGPKYDRSRFKKELDYWVACLIRSMAWNPTKFGISKTSTTTSLRGKMQSTFLTSILKCFTDMIGHGLWRGISDTPS